MSCLKEKKQHQMFLFLLIDVHTDNLEPCEGPHPSRPASTERCTAPQIKSADKTVHLQQIARYTVVHRELSVQPLTFWIQAHPTRARHTLRHT